MKTGDIIRLDKGDIVVYDDYVLTYLEDGEFEIRSIIANIE